MTVDLYERQLDGTRLIKTVPETSEVSGTGFEKIVIWAEESGALSGNNTQWSFGNGATGSIGIPLPEAWELYALTLQIDTTSTGNDVEIDIMNFATGVTQLGSFNFNNIGSNNGVGIITGLSLALPAGIVLGFRTGTETGANNDARVAAWLRRTP